MQDWKWALTPTHAGLVRTIEQMSCGLLVEDEKGNILYVNQRILEWSGYQVHDLQGCPVEKLVPPELHGFWRPSVIAPTRAISARASVLSNVETDEPSRSPCPHREPTPRTASA